MGGGVYQEGNGVEQDFEQTRDWYQRAADQGLARAQHGLGVLYATGRGVERADYTEAARWFELAARQDFAKAQYNLALLALAGRGTVRDPDRARKLLERAAAGGEEDAERLLLSLGDEAARDEATEVARPLALAEATPGGIGTPAQGGPAPMTATAPQAPQAPTAPVAGREPTRAPPATSARTSEGNADITSFTGDFEDLSSAALTLQLSSLSTPASAERFAARIRGVVAEDYPVYVVAYEAAGSVRHAVLVGAFSGRGAAQAAATRLRPALDGDPWIRRVGDVQALIED